jgi:hypothetical protein
VADRIRLRLNSDLAALLSAEQLRALEGISLPYRSGDESVAARVEQVEFGDSGFFVTLVLDEGMPPGMARLMVQDDDGRMWIRLPGSSVPVPETGGRVVGEDPAAQGGDGV